MAQIKCVFLKREVRRATIKAHLNECRSQCPLMKHQPKKLEDAYVSGMYRAVESGIGSANTAML